MGAREGMQEAIDLGIEIVTLARIDGGDAAVQRLEGEDPNRIILALVFTTKLVSCLRPASDISQLAVDLAQALSA